MYRTRFLKNVATFDWLRSTTGIHKGEMRASLSTNRRTKLYPPIKTNVRKKTSHATRHATPTQTNLARPLFFCVHKQTETHKRHATNTHTYTKRPGPTIHTAAFFRRSSFSEWGHPSTSTRTSLFHTSIHKICEYNTANVHATRYFLLRQ